MALASPSEAYAVDIFLLLDLRLSVMSHCVSIGSPEAQLCPLTRFPCLAALSPASPSLLDFKILGYNVIS